MGHSIYNAYVIVDLQYSNFCLSRESASLYSDRFYFKNANVHADNFRHKNKPFCIGIGMKYITVNQLQLNYSTNINH